MSSRTETLPVIMNPVPILNKFIEEHPDFVYKNARPTLCLSGYNGILGYRTSQNLGEMQNLEIFMRIMEFLIIRRRLKRSSRC